MSISLASLVFNWDFPVRTLTNQWYTQRKSVFMCNIIAYHLSTRLTPLSIVSSSTTLICWVSFISHYQHVSSMRDHWHKVPLPQSVKLCPPTCPALSGLHATLPELDLVAIPGWAYPLSYVPKVHHWFFLSQFCMTAMARCLMKPVTTCSHPHTGKCPTSLPHMEKVPFHIRVIGLFSTLLPHRYHSRPCSPRLLVPALWHRTAISLDPC